MKIGPIVIDRFAKWIVGGVAFEAAKSIVATLEDSGLSSEKKRNTAIAQLSSFGYQLAGFLLNLAIELAVAWLKSKNGTLPRS